MAVSKDEILEAIANMTVMEVVELIGAMEEKFGVTAAAAVAAAPAAGGGGEAAAAEEQTEFDVVLTSFGANKVSVIKAVRATDRSGSEGSEGGGGRRPEHPQGRGFQGRGRRGEEGVGRGWRDCRSQVTARLRRFAFSRGERLAACSCRPFPVCRIVRPQGFTSGRCFRRVGPVAAARRRVAPAPVLPGTPDGASAAKT